MTDEKSLINIGELAEPATVLIERVSDAIGGYFKPWQIRRVAEAEADAKTLEALTELKISEVYQRALQRFIAEEAKKQNNMESITAKALPQLDKDSRPQDIEDDWITNFFDKCRLISDEQMQDLWARLLAGEANSPGTFSRRTVNLLNSLDKSDAISFTVLCAFSWSIAGDSVPLILDREASIYRSNGISFIPLQHLDGLGLISFQSLGGYHRRISSSTIRTLYYGIPVDIEFQEKFADDEDYRLDCGCVLFSRSGYELAKICDSGPIPDFVDYVTQTWSQRGMIVSSPTLQEQ